jgi:hypothetical protein
MSGSPTEGTAVNGLISLFTHFSAPRASRWLIAMSLALLTAWLQSHILLAALHDDGTTARNAIAVYNSPDVRGQVSGVVDWAFTQGASLTGAGAEADAVRAEVVKALGSGQLSAPVSDALVTALVDLRDDALAQFDGSGPTHALTLDAAPLLAALDIPVTAETAKQLGLPASAGLALPIVPAQTVDGLRSKYHWAQLTDAWGLLAAAVLGLAGIFLSPRPLRTLAIVVGLGGVACLVAIPLFGVLQGWLVGGGAGPWSPLVAPLVSSALAELRPWLLPVGIAAVIVGAGGLAGWIVWERRKGTSSASPAPGPAFDDAADRPAVPVS